MPTTPTEVDVTQIRPSTTAYQIIGTNSGATLNEYLTLSAGTNVTITPSGTSITIAATGSSGANTALSNLSSVAVNTSILPGTTASISLGSSILDWLDTYAEINQVAQAQAGDQTIASGFNASVPISHGIPVGHTLFVSLGSFFQIT